MLLQLLWLQVLMQLAASDMVVSLRDLLRKEASKLIHNHATSERRAEKPSTSGGRTDGGQRRQAETLYKCRSGTFVCERELQAFT